MIQQPGQLQLFAAIARELTADVTCYAFGGTAMMFFGYKDETKDVDLLFETLADRVTFLHAISDMGFSRSSPVGVYMQKKSEDVAAPLMYTRENYRLDLFAKTIFRTILSDTMRSGVIATHEFRGTHVLRVNVIRPEHIVYLKGITSRVNDDVDIRTILSLAKDFSWDLVIDEAILQHANGDTWALLDTEKTVRALQGEFAIPAAAVKRLYAAQP
jgi:hypothetical protein